MTARSSADQSHMAPPNHDDPVGIFAENLKAARMKAGLSQADLAERTGLLRQYISLVESGRQDITLKTALVLASGVRRDVIRLLTRKKPIPRKG